MSVETMTKGSKMMQSGSVARLGRFFMASAACALALSACGKKADDADADDTPAATADAGTGTPAAAPAAAAAPAPDNIDTTDGTKFASFTGDAAKGKIAFLTCQTCHAIDVGVNKIGPSLHAVVGRKAGTIAGFNYSAANKNSGITWSEAKLFQYLENPQRVVPGTKMTFAGYPEAQKRADVIAYLKTNS